MSAFGSASFEEIIARGCLRETDLTKLRAWLDGAVKISRRDAEGLFAIHAQCAVKDAGWPDFFIGAMSDYIVHAAEPVGYVTQEKAGWLIQQITRNGRVETRTELDLLIDVLENARWAPRSLIALGLNQVQQAATVGDGPLRPGQPRAPGQLFDEEIEIVRRLVYAFGGDRCTAMTREEAEILFQINDALDGARLNTAWTELFVKAIANVMLAASGYGVPSREEALRAEAWFDERSQTAPVDVVKAIVKSGLDGVLEAYQQQTRVEQSLRRLEREYLTIITGEEPKPDNVDWLTERFGRSEALSLNEMALVSYFAEVQVTVEPVLQEVLERVRSAA